MSWTDERIEKLAKMWEGGSTASQIAEELGGVSRNAVIGKAHRLGLKARPSPVKANEKPKKAAAPAKKAKAPPAPRKADEPVAETPRPEPAAPVWLLDFKNTTACFHPALLAEPELAAASTRRRGGGSKPHPCHGCPYVAPHLTGRVER